MDYHNSHSGTMEGRNSYVTTPQLTLCSNKAHTLSGQRFAALQTSCTDILESIKMHRRGLWYSLNTHDEAQISHCDER